MGIPRTKVDGVNIDYEEVPDEKNRPEEAGAIGDRTRSLIIYKRL